MEILHTTACGMFRVIKKDGLFYPQERRVTCSSYTGARIPNVELERDLMAGKWSVYDSGWRGFHLGYVGTRSKGYKSLKTEKGAIAFAERCSANLQADWTGF